LGLWKRPLFGRSSGNSRVEGIGLFLDRILIGSVPKGPWRVFGLEGNYLLRVLGWTNKRLWGTFNGTFLGTFGDNVGQGAW